jgi:hypothetical protein
MSLDKFVMRGFTGSMGSGEGRWVSSSSQYQGQAERQSVITHQGGTSFVMGGGPLKGRPAVKDNTGRSSRDELYSSDPDRGKYTGTGQQGNGYYKTHGNKSFVEWAGTSKGHRVVVGIAFYAIFLILGIVLLVRYFGLGSNDSFYSAPAGFSREMRPMWDR